jgi:hypothetical protein
LDYILLARFRQTQAETGAALWINHCAKGIRSPSAQRMLTHFKTQLAAPRLPGLGVFPNEEQMIEETDQYRLEHEYTIGEIKKALGTDSIEFISELGEGLTKLRADGKDVSLRDAVIKVELMRAATKEPK